MSTTTTKRRPLEEYLRLQYPFNVIADPDGGYVIVYPDLPGCMTQVDDTSEIAEIAEDARRLWIETEYEQGAEIPLPSYPEEYSGKFNVRIPKSLHRELAASAEREGVSLNQYVTMLLGRGDAQAQIERRVEEARDEIMAEIHEMHSSLGYTLRSGLPRSPRDTGYMVGTVTILSSVAA